MLDVFCVFFFGFILGSIGEHHRVADDELGQRLGRSLIDSRCVFDILFFTLSFSTPSRQILKLILGQIH